jgi:predicted GIY-YIG superfamily endonuclease
MNETFRLHVESLQLSFEKLMSMSPAKVCALPKTMPKRGIYLFSERDEHWYVGRTNRLRQRLGEHCRKSSTHNSAPFAFLLAREMCRQHSTHGTRTQLERHEVFGPAFIVAKNRVSAMDVRFVEESDALRQALLEMYAAIALGTKYNSFENH